MGKKSKFSRRSGRNGPSPGSICKCINESIDRLPRIKALQQADEMEHDIAMQIGFRHRFAIRFGIVDFGEFDTLRHLGPVQCS